MPRSRTKPSTPSANSTKTTASGTDASQGSSDSTSKPSRKSAATSAGQQPPKRGSAWIYALTDEDGTIRYIGKSVNPEARLQTHIREARIARGVNKHKEAWIRQLLARNETPKLLLLERCCDDTWEAAERQWIQRHQRTLTNKAAGGNSPGCSAKTRKSNYNKMMRHRYAPLAAAKRIMNLYAIQAAKRGDMTRARKFVECIVSMDCSKGIEKDRLNVWAKETFCHEAKAK